MSDLLKDLRDEYKNAYESKGMNPKNYIEAKIYHGGKDYDLSKRWCVYYSYRDAKTGKMKRQTPIYLKVNRNFKTKEERMFHLTLIKNIINERLSAGRAPASMGTLPPDYTVEGCLDYALKVKKSEIKATSFQEYSARVKHFKKFLESRGLLKSSIKSIDKRCVSQYLNTFHNGKYSNNTKIVLNAMFKVLSDENYIEFNFIKEIRNKKVIKKPVRIYTQEEVATIVEKLEAEDPSLLMFIYFISYMFWRPLEIVRIKDTDIDLNKGVISVETKSKALKTKIIPKLLLNGLKTFVHGKRGYIFEPEGADWSAKNETSRKRLFTRKFAKFRERHGMSSEFKLYSFRHTFVTKIYLELRKNLTKEESVKHLSLITGHESSAIYAYIQVNDLELPEDYSHLIK